MPSVLNEMLLRELTENYKTAEGVVVLSMQGLTMAENEKLRNALAAETGTRLRIVPNRIARRALAEVGLDFAEEVFSGSSIGVVVGSPEATIGVAKVVTTHETTKAGKVAFRGGALEGNVLGAEDTKALADVPDKDTLRAKILGCISGPAQGLVGVLAANGGSLARVLQARIDKEGGAE